MRRGKRAPRAEHAGSEGGESGRRSDANVALESAGTFVASVEIEMIERQFVGNERIVRKSGGGRMLEVFSGTLLGLKEGERPR